jgi:hypothetical protein
MEGKYVLDSRLGETLPRLRELEEIHCLIPWHASHWSSVFDPAIIRHAQGQIIRALSYDLQFAQRRFSCNSCKHCLRFSSGSIPIAFCL